MVAVEGLDGEPGAIGSKVDDRLARVIVQVHDLVDDFRDAISTRTPVTFTHEGRTRVLEPWALGVWRNHWYVAGGDPAHDHEMRRFRLDRIDAPPTGHLDPAGEPGSFTVVDWFDVDKAFDFDPNSWGHDPVLDARHPRRDRPRGPRSSTSSAARSSRATPTTCGSRSRSDTTSRSATACSASAATRWSRSRAELVDLVRAHLAAVAEA